MADSDKELSTIPVLRKCAHNTPENACRQVW